MARPYPPPPPLPAPVSSPGKLDFSGFQETPPLFKSWKLIILLRVQLASSHQF